MSADLREWAEIVLTTYPKEYTETLEPLLQAMFRRMDDLERDLADKEVLLKKADEAAAEFRDKNSDLAERLALAVHEQFGRSSEKAGSLNVRADEEMTVPSSPSDDGGDQTSADEKQVDRDNSRPTRRKNQKNKRSEGRQPTTFPEHLPRESVVFEIEEGCQKCGGPVDQIGADTRSFLVASVKFRVREEVYPKHRCKCCRHIQQVPAPFRITQGSQYDRSIFAEIIASKFDMGSPYYRLEDAMQRQGIQISRSTMSRGLIRIWRNLQTLEKALRKHVLDGAVIHADETRLPF